MKKHIKDEKGNSFVEFALVLPIMLIILSLIFDMGRAVHAKSNLQYLAGEIQKVVVLYEEAGTTGGIRVYSRNQDRDKLVKKIIEDNKSLDKTKLTYKITSDGVEERSFIGHHYDPGKGFVLAENRNDIEYITATVEYTMTYGMFVTRAILGDNIKFSESYTGLMYVGGDGWN